MSYKNVNTAKYFSFILNQLLASCTFTIKIYFEINLKTNKLSLDSEKSTQTVLQKSKEASDKNLSIENSGNIFKESLENNLSQSNVEENKGQATFVIEVNRDMKEVLEQPTSTITTTEQKRGGFTCFVLFCYNNSKVNKGLSVNVILKEPVFRKKWLYMIYRKNFNPTSRHRVCSEHFVGGKKTYENNAPTIVPKTFKPIVFKERKSRNSLGLTEKTTNSI